MSEYFAFQEFFAKCRTIYCNEISFISFALVVNRLGENFLSCTGLSG